MKLVDAKQTPTAVRFWISADRECTLAAASCRTAAVGAQFGLPIAPVAQTILAPTRMELAPGRITLILGPSGSGKSTTLAEIDRRFPAACAVQRVSFDNVAAVIDHVCPGQSLSQAMGLLTAAGLGEPRLWLRRFDELSDGEQFRARLAKAVGVHWRAPGSLLLCDEFGSLLSRRSAKAISHNLRKLVTRHGLTVVLAAAHDDVVADLQPDTIMHIGGSGRVMMQHREVQHGRRVSFARRLQIVRGKKGDYDAFSAMHYRATDELGFVDKVFVLQDPSTSEPLGIVVYAHPPIELALRNAATSHRYSKNPSRLNRDVRILRRLVIHPEVRGCGLGHYLVRKTMPLVGTRHIECLTTMGEVTPVFEKAGMVRIGQYPLSRKRQAAVQLLADMHVDVNAGDFAGVVGRNRHVRKIVADTVRDWYAATTGGGEQRVSRQSPETLAQTFRGLVYARPVYYLWSRSGTSSSFVEQAA